MNLQALRGAGCVRSSDAFPRSTTKQMTDDEWQENFKILKAVTIPSVNKKMGGQYSVESGRWNRESSGAYYGTTNWQQYCSFINNVLNNIRSGGVDFCYFTYQIKDLLSFELSRLETRYNPQDKYWSVWLKKGAKI